MLCLRPIESSLSLFKCEQGASGAGAEPWCTCELDEFLDLVEDLKQTLLSCRAVAESVVTPSAPPPLGAYGDDVSVLWYSKGNFIK